MRWCAERAREELRLAQPDQRRARHDQRPVADSLARRHRCEAWQDPRRDYGLTHHGGQEPIQGHAGQEPARAAREHRGLGARPRPAQDSPERRGCWHPGKPGDDQQSGALVESREGRLNIMLLKTLKPAPGAKRVRLRVGRGASAGQGKTCGRGTKGQRARKGGYHKVGFEGGQMPIQRRMPKVGFRSKMASSRAEVMLSELGKIKGDVIDLEALKKAGVIPVFAEKAKVVLSGKIERAVTLKGVGATKGTLAAIEAAGGKLEA